MPGNRLRNRFLASGLQTDEQRYSAYWTVRRHVGKGAPPRALASVAEMLELVSQTPGAMGYIDAAAATPALNVLCRLWPCGPAQAWAQPPVSSGASKASTSAGCRAVLADVLPAAPSTTSASAALRCCSASSRSSMLPAATSR